MKRGRLRWAALSGLCRPTRDGRVALVHGRRPGQADRDERLGDARGWEGPQRRRSTGSPQEAAPGSFVAIKVTATLASGQTWRSTSYAFGSGSEACDNDANRSSAGTFTEYVEATLPETTPTPGSVTVRLYAADGCSGTPLASPASTFTIRPRTANQALAPHCDTRVALVLDESGRSAARAERNRR